MRYCLIFLSLFCFIFSQIQRAKITQSYVYEAKEGDFIQTQKDGEIYLQITSPSLLDFLNSKNPHNTLATQTVRLNGTWTEFQSHDENVKSYSNSNEFQHRFNLKAIAYRLQEVESNVFKLMYATQPIKIEHCKFVIQKDLINTLAGKRDFVINLDNQYYFDKLIATYRFIQCDK
ncbi:hypothetical protein CQA62_01870 [Helicobacter cholecystus]|uniref:Periplasmic protein n=1 Tax=Helicobacter cholecystus TaxID=45498 RepID=A0A3D8IVW2_9HELI|nr:hypothetical protein [Helicobacter cholecystus]RDU69419.1 hypothetical protein CQA62_01870 [Helicobacter cholecystus]VEJ23967.1 Uncharacterised protein [Helicobacter cholecystus]